MKRLFCILLCCLLCFSVSACKSKDKKQRGDGKAAVSVEKEHSTDLDSKTDCKTESNADSKTDSDTESVGNLKDDIIGEPSIEVEPDVSEEETGSEDVSGKGNGGSDTVNDTNENQENPPAEAPVSDGWINADY